MWANGVYAANSIENIIVQEQDQNKTLSKSRHVTLPSELVWNSRIQYFRGIPSPTQLPLFCTSLCKVLCSEGPCFLPKDHHERNVEINTTTKTGSCARFLKQDRLHGFVNPTHS